MKRFKLRTLVAVCLAVSVVGGALTVFSLATGNTSTVTYDHDAKEFVFNRTPYVDQDGHKFPDLFAEFKQMMPGDTATQTITVGADNLGRGTAYIYLRTDAENAGDITKAEQQDYQKLLASKHVQMTVKQGDTVLAEGDLAQGVLLGKFRNDDEVKLDVTLSIDKAAGNELQGLRAGIGWVFTAEYHEPPRRPSSTPALRSVEHYAYMVGYPDGLVHPEKQITRAETATIFFRMLTDESREEFWSQVNPYYDVRPEDWYNNAVSTLTYAGVLNGYPDGNFLPQSNITRAEFAAMAVRFFEGDEEEVDGDAFPDIKKHWANAEINLAYAKGIIEGYPDGTFKPDQEITRAEAVTIVNRVLERYPHKEHLLEDMIVWPDNMDETMWYYADIQEATNSHLYDLNRDDEDAPYEIWTELLPVRDWVALEQMWSEFDSAYNPGEVVSSIDASRFKD